MLKYFINITLICVAGLNESHKQWCTRY